MNNNKKSPVITIVVILVVGLVLGYLLFRSTPQNQTLSSAGVDNMYGGTAVVNNSKALDALVGKTMPAIQLADKDGKVLTLADFKGKTLVLFFNEGLMCYPACWNQIVSFGSDQRFNSDEIQAVSVVADSASDWERAITQMPQLAKATTLFDTGVKVSRQLGMLTTASSMHKGMLPGHTYLVVDKVGVIRYVLDDPNMAIANDKLFAKIGELK